MNDMAIVPNSVSLLKNMTEPISLEISCTKNFIIHDSQMFSKSQIIQIFECIPGNPSSYVVKFILSTWRAPM